MARLAISWLISISVLLVAGSARAEKRVALVIGNSSYQYISKLDNPSNDARLIAETLRTVGFSLIGGAALIDLNKSKFDDAVQNFGKEIAGADVALFYYAGHGVQVRGSNYLVPTGANPTREADVDFQMIDAALVLRQMEGTGTKLNLVILDACRNNPFGGRGLRSSTAGLAQMNAPEGTLISYATQPGAVAQDGADGDSPYTKALAQTLRRPGLGIFEVFNEIGLTVKRSTAGSQQPWVASSPIDGNFYFVPPSGEADRPASGSLAAEAAQAWSAVKDTKSTQVLEAFVQRYRDTFYADLARARLDELRLGPKSAEVATTELPRTDAEQLSAVGASRQRAVLYDEDVSDAKGRQYVGSVVWRVEQVNTVHNKKADTAVRADIEIPERKFKMTMSLRRNTDPSLPASHTVELTFILPRDFSGGGIGNVPGILMKSNEQTRGLPLAGLGVKVTDGFFLVGLSNVAADRGRNIQLLREQSWFDIPLVYSDQRRAILAVEKGLSGREVFGNVLAAWGQAASSKQVISPAAMSRSSGSAVAPAGAIESLQGETIFPSGVSPKYSSEDPGRARMLTCRDQYVANKAANANGGLLWVQQGGGYYAECNKRLKG
nr:MULTISPECIES: caspase family protein [unclassified Bradyrhizobium]